MSEDTVREILLREYAEAGNVTRNQEQLSRTSISIFLPSFVVLVGFLLGSSVSYWAKLGLSLGGFTIAIALFNTILRLRAYARCYFERAREIEGLIKVDGLQVMHLYSNGANVNHRCTIPNKIALASVLGLAALYSGVSAFYFGLRILCPEKF